MAWVRLAEAYQDAAMQSLDLLSELEVYSEPPVQVLPIAG